MLLLLELTENYNRIENNDCLTVLHSCLTKLKTCFFFYDLIRVFLFLHFNFVTIYLNEAIHKFSSLDVVVVHFMHTQTNGQ